MYYIFDNLIFSKKILRPRVYGNLYLKEEYLYLLLLMGYKSLYTGLQQYLNLGCPQGVFCIS